MSITCVVFEALLYSGLFTNQAPASAVVSPTELPKQEENVNADPQCVFLESTKDLVACYHEDITTLPRFPKNSTKISILDFNITSLEGSPFDYLTDLVSLEFANSRLRKFADSVFVGLNQLQKLDLRNNLLNELPKNIFLPCPRLSDVNLSGNRFRTLQSAARALGVLQNLTSLNLIRNPLLNTIQEHDLEPLSNTSLAVLNLRECQMSFIHSKALGSIPSLQELDLSSNKFTEDNLNIAFSSLPNTTIRVLHLRRLYELKRIPRSAFQHLKHTRIQVLILSQNNFKLIREDDFPELPYLKKLNLDWCQINRIETTALKNFKNLINLHLSNNYLLGIPSTIGELKFLGELDVQNNYVRRLRFSIDEKTFANNTELVILVLQRILLVKIRRYSFYGLSNLKFLNVMNAEIEQIDDFSFETLNSLEYLALSHNVLNHPFTSNTFAGLQNLKNLYLRNMDLKTPITLFYNLPNLKYIDLSQNKLSTIPLDELQLSPKLEKLNLNKNTIVPWHTITVPPDSNLSSLLLSSNRIVTVTFAMMADFSNLQHLDIAENPFNCSMCELKVFQEWSKQSSLQYNKTLVCLYPENLRGQSIFQVTDFDHCIYLEKNILVPVVVSLSVIFVILVTAFGICYYFRWHLRYCWFTSRYDVKRLRQHLAADNYTYDAFVSYNENDRPWILEHLLPKTEEMHPQLRLCLHERDFEIGREIMYNIVDSIETSRKVVLLLSENFLKSQWCMWEMKMAQFKLIDDNRDALVLVLLEPISKKKMTSTLNYLIRTRTYLPWINNSPQAEKLFWEKFCYALRKPEKKGVIELESFI